MGLTVHRDVLSQCYSKIEAANHPRNSFSTQFSLLDDAEGPKSTEDSGQAIKPHSSGSRGVEGKRCDASG